MPSIDLRVLGAAAAATILAALFFGVVPSLRACRGLDADGLREGARGGIGGRRARLVRALVVAEVAASLVLLVVVGPAVAHAVARAVARSGISSPAGC